MPISLSAKKSLRSSVAKRKQNLIWKKKLKETTRAFLKKPDKKLLGSVYSVLDKMGKKKIMHKNKIARLKSRYSKKVKAVIKKKSPSKKK